MRARGVIFDFDGTIADTWKVANVAYKSTFHRFNQRELTDEELLTYAGPTEDVIVRKMVPHAPDEAEEYFFSEFILAHADCTGTFDGVLPLLSQLKDASIRLSIVTAKGPRAADISLAQIPIGHMFEKVHTATPDEPRKTTRILSQIKHWSLAASDVAYIGDTAGDMQQAREAGVVPLGAAWGGVDTREVLQDAGAVSVFEQPAQLMPWLTGTDGDSGA